MTKHTPRKLAGAKGRRILRLPAVIDKSGLSRSQVYRLLGHMRIKLGPNTSGWIESDIDRWLGERIAATHDGDHIIPPSERFAAAHASTSAAE